MAPAAPSTAKPKNEGTASLLAFFLAGSGHAYAGHVGEGIAWFFFVAATGAIGGLLNYATGYVVFLFAGVLPWLIQVGTAASSCKRASHERAPAIYFLLAVAFFGLIVTYIEVDAYKRREIYRAFMAPTPTPIVRDDALHTFPSPPSLPTARIPGQVYGACHPNGWTTGKCVAQDECRAYVTHGLCPGDADVVCCFEAVTPPPDPVAE